MKTIISAKHTGLILIKGKSNLPKFAIKVSTGATYVMSMIVGALCDQAIKGHEINKELGQAVVNDFNSQRTDLKLTLLEDVYDYLPILMSNCSYITINTDKQTINLTNQVLTTDVNEFQIMIEALDSQRTDHQHFRIINMSGNEDVDISKVPFELFVRFAASWSKKQDHINDDFVIMSGTKEAHGAVFCNRNY